MSYDNQMSIIKKIYLKKYERSKNRCTKKTDLRNHLFTVTPRVDVDASAVVLLLLDTSQWLPPSEHQSMCSFVYYEGIMSSLMHKCTHCTVKRRVASSPPAVQRPQRTLLKEQWELPSISANQLWFHMTPAWIYKDKMTDRTSFLLFQPSGRPSPHAVSQNALQQSISVTGCLTLLTQKVPTLWA